MLPHECKPVVECVGLVHDFCEPHEVSPPITKRHFFMLLLQR
jgi:hypothetical protein